MTRSLSPRSTLLVLVAAQILVVVVLVAVLVYIVRVGNDNARTNLRLTQINRAALMRDCHDKEELKGVMRDVLKTVILLNSQASDPELRARVDVYRALLVRVKSIPCND